MISSMWRSVWPSKDVTGPHPNRKWYRTLQAAGHSPYHPTSPSRSAFGFGQNTYTLQATQSNCVWLWQDSSWLLLPFTLVFQLGSLCSQHCWETEKPPDYCVYVPSWRSCTTWATSVGFRYLHALPLLSISKEKKPTVKERYLQINSIIEVSLPIASPVQLLFVPFAQEQVKLIHNYYCFLTGGGWYHRGAFSLLLLIRLFTAYNYGGSWLDQVQTRLMQSFEKWPLTFCI